MLSKFKIKVKNKNEILALVSLIILTASFTSYYNYTKKQIKNNYNEIINNVYFKKTTDHFFNKLEPKFKKIKHKIEIGETFDLILNGYSINKGEIQSLKIKLSEKIDLNKLNTDQKIYLTIDQSNNKIKEFILQISNKERILLTRNEEEDDFNQEIILKNLIKKFYIRKILLSLYRAAKNKKIPANTIIELARIYGFQVDFQRDIRKQDRFQIM